MLQQLFLLVKREEGQDIAEYAMLVALIAVVAAVAVEFFGDEVTAFFNSLPAALGF